MRTSFTTSQIAQVVRLTSPKFNVRVNKAGNLAIESSSLFTGTRNIRYVLYKTPKGYVIRKGYMDDLAQKKYSRLGKTTNGVRAYTFPTFKDAFEYFKASLIRTKVLV